MRPARRIWKTSSGSRTFASSTTRRGKPSHASGRAESAHATEGLNRYSRTVTQPKDQGASQVSRHLRKKNETWKSSGHQFTYWSFHYQVPEAADPLDPKTWLLTLKRGLFRSALDSLTGFRKEICGLPPQLALPVLRLLETILKGNPQLHICIFVALIRNHSRQDMERLHPFATFPSRKNLD